MSQHSKIPPILHEEVIQLHEEGISAEGIRSYLLQKYQLECNRTNVYLVLNNHKKEKQIVTQKIYAEAAEKHAYKDLEIIDEAIDLCRKKYKASFDAGNDGVAVKTLDVMFKFINKRMDLSGLGQLSNDAEALIEEAKEALIKRFGSN